METLHTTTQLVVLDATVVDKQGHVVTAPLTRDDFEVQEDHRPQAIRYFESVAEHDIGVASGTPNKAPLLIAVLDEVNFPYHHAESNADNLEDQVNDYESLRSELVRYLQTQPAALHADPKAPVKTTVALELHLPAKTKRVRFVVRDLANGRMGTTEVSMKAVQSAPEQQEQKSILGRQVRRPIGDPQGCGVRCSSLRLRWPVGQMESRGQPLQRGLSKVQSVCACSLMSA